ncbi:hypothetical protein L326_13770 [Yersinia pestis 113]|nr:hypothetical protein INS_14365 [Yersinia pestis INS]ERP71372.1 hypothetical protein L327_13900 [Yersinia pestis S3]ERP72715.1 hypothetical protein L326_13770 [Yersinia pestis 113]QOW13871.1 hypothetical protein S96127_1566 [Yersinia pestis]
MIKCVNEVIECVNEGNEVNESVNEGNEC